MRTPCNWQNVACVPVRYPCAPQVQGRRLRCARWHARELSAHLMYSNSKPDVSMPSGAEGLRSSEAHNAAVGRR